jgi:hypothetical protein
MKYGIEGLNRIRKMINSEELKEKGRKSPKDFTRERKMGFSKVIKYNINKKGLTSAMELNKYFEESESESMSTQSMLDQRKKLNPTVFKILNAEYLKGFYTEHEAEVKTYKGYLLKAIDGSDIEVPNTQETREKFGEARSKSAESVARAGVSVLYDVLNNYILASEAGEFHIAEIKAAVKHMESEVTDDGGSITGNFDSIYLMDRNYVSICFMTYMEMRGKKFLQRLKSNSYYMEETSRMSENDEILELKHTKHRMEKYRFFDEDIRKYAKSKKHTRVRVLKHTLSTGEIEYLITNIEDFSYDEIVELYSKRWGIETLYYSLKWKLQLEKFTSANRTIIEQDIFSSVLVYNMVQTLKTEAEETIEQSRYKHEMKVNENMAIGLFKSKILRIMLETNDELRLKLYDALCADMAKHIIPVRKGRRYPRKFKRYNRHSFNKSRSF